MAGASKLALLLATPFPIIHRLHRHCRTLSLRPLSTAPHGLSSQKPFAISASSLEFHTQPSYGNTVRDAGYYPGQPFTPVPAAASSHPWPEWSKLVETLYAAGYLDWPVVNPDDGFVDYGGLPDEFVRAANASLAFARDRPDILGLLSRRDMETLAENGTPFLFQSAANAERRMRSFLFSTGPSYVVESDRAQTVDLIKYIVSYASNPIPSGGNNICNTELTEASVRYLLSELADMSCRAPDSDVHAVEQYQNSGRYGQTTRLIGSKIEVRRGDWICTKKKDRSLTSPAYKRQESMEQGSNTNFVPFPPDYFAKKDKQQLGSIDSIVEPANVTYPNHRSYEKSGNAMPMNDVIEVPRKEAPQTSTQALFSGDYRGPLNPNQYSCSFGSQSIGSNSWNTSAQNTASQTSNSGGNPHGPPESRNVRSGWTGKSLEGLAVKEPDPLDMSEETKAERCFRRVAQINDVSELSQIPDEGFPSIMPMRKQVNRFVVSNRKTLERRLTSPAYKRQESVEQGSNTNFVPFVPFPPDYFAKKDKQQLGSIDSKVEPANVTYPNHRYYEKSGNAMPMNDMFEVPRKEALQTSTLALFSGDYRGPLSSNQYSSSFCSQSIGSNSWNTSAQNTASQTSNSGGNPLGPPESQNVRSGWTGKSLEGSAVKEPDPLDTSEEAKAERWFRRVAQSKDLSELSQIPDEDFPSIIPIRKEVKRFVVSKIKTALERLTSPAYKRKESVEQGSNTNFVPFVPFPPDYFVKLDKQQLGSIDSKVEPANVTSPNNRSYEKSGSAMSMNDMIEVPREEAPGTSTQALFSGDYRGPLTPNQHSSSFGSQSIGSNNLNTSAQNTASQTSNSGGNPCGPPESQNVRRRRISKRKGRSSTSPAYKRQESVEQGGNTNFVPFPPDCFAKEDKQQLGSIDSKVEPANVTSPNHTSYEKSGNAMPMNDMIEVPREEALRTSTQALFSGDYRGPPSPNQYLSSFGSQGIDSNSGNTSAQNTGSQTSNSGGNPRGAPESQKVRSDWIGKSLEESAVKEPDLLDMSEEANAERWFRHVARIKNISELSQIPNEDFPVSDRETLQAMRLASTIYHKELPVVNSLPIERENDTRVRIFSSKECIVSCPIFLKPYLNPLQDDPKF